MSGGRPRGDGNPRRPELEELAAWFDEAITQAGYASKRQFCMSERQAPDLVYGVVGAAKFFPLRLMRSLAEVVGRSPQDAERVWLRTKTTIEREMRLRARESAAPLQSWADIPLPDHALDQILTAQAQSVEQLPYKLLGLAAPPELSMVYVRQKVKVQPTAGTRPPEKDLLAQSGGDARSVPRAEPPPAAEGPVSLSAALDRHEHLLITGDPGVGKSTLGQNLARSLSRLWLRDDAPDRPPLREPVVPLRVPATALQRPEAWSEVLAGAAKQLCRLMLTIDPPSGLFAGRVHGARWLILIDGLDEIVDRDQRMQIVRGIAAHARPGSDYRIVVTTRPLPTAELGPLHLPHIGSYSLEGFSKAELSEFAHLWFRSQAPESAPEQTALFLREVGDGRLSDLVRNPLLATVTAIARTLEPERPLPPNRIELYERFHEYLMARPCDTGNSWLHEHRRELVGHLARTRLESGGSLIEAATGWAGRQPGAVRATEEEVRQELLSTGLLVVDGEDVRFLHQSFAEFLQAQAEALAMGPTGLDLQKWVQRSYQPDQQGFALLTLASWCRIPGHDSGLALAPLLHLTSSRQLVAGRLLAEGIQADPELEAAVVDRLVDQGLGRTAAGSYANNVFEVLALIADRPVTRRKLLRLATDNSLPPRIRIEAAGALAPHGDRQAARDVFVQTAGLAGALDLLRAGELIGDSSLDDCPEVAREIRQMGASPRTPASVRADAGQVLASMGADGALECALAVLADDTSSGQSLAIAMETLATLNRADAGADFVMALQERPGLSTESCALLADSLAEAGFPEAAAAFVDRVLGDTADNGWQTLSALGTLADVYGYETACARAEAFLASPGLNTGLVSAAALALARFGARDLALRTADLVLENESVFNVSLTNALRAVFTVGDAEASARWVDRLRNVRITNFEHASLAQELSRIGLHDEATYHARRALSVPRNLAGFHYESCVNVFFAATDTDRIVDTALFLASDHRVARQLRQVLARVAAHGLPRGTKTLAAVVPKGFGRLPRRWTAGIDQLTTVFRDGTLELLLSQISGHPEGEELTERLVLLLESFGRSAAELTGEVVGRRKDLSSHHLWQIAQAAMAQGALGLAVELCSELLRDHPEEPDDARLEWATAMIALGRRAELLVLLAEIAGDGKRSARERAAAGRLAAWVQYEDLSPPDAG